MSSALEPKVDLEDLRAEVRAFLAARYDEVAPDGDDRREDIITEPSIDEADFAEAAVALQRELAQAGLGAVHVPAAYGGRGLTPAHKAVVESELRRFATPSTRPLRIGLHLALSTILEWGTEEQKQRFIPPLIRGEQRWCQLFSEPDAGSDLVSMRTRARRDDQRWVVDGQKVWSSYAAGAHHGLLLARTGEPTDKPQAAISMFVLPMDAPGVTVRPLVDITGGNHFTEVVLEGVELTDADLLGPLHQGWTVSQRTLGSERSGYMGGSGGGRRRRQVIAAARRSGRLCDPVARQGIAAVVGAERVLELLRDRYAAGTLCDGHPAAASMMKLFGGSLEQRSAELVADLTGAHGQAWLGHDGEGATAAHDVVAARQARIAGGTHEVQRNVLAERVLGLPRQAR